ncbi:MAG: hypothetical protein P8Z36_06370 [Gemmatimonadota bacterium]|jgi:pyridoxal biosynthesis lyase PdxS
MKKNTAYRFAVGVALAAALVLVWMNLAVGLIGTPDDLANLMYVGVLVVGVIGTIVARFRPHGMARALFATAFAQALAAVIAVAAGLGTPGLPPQGVFLMMNGFFVALFAASALLFRYAEPPLSTGR